MVKTKNKKLKEYHTQLYFVRKENDRQAIMSAFKILWHSMIARL